MPTQTTPVAEVKTTDHQPGRIRGVTHLYLLVLPATPMARRGRTWAVTSGHWITLQTRDSNPDDVVNSHACCHYISLERLGEKDSNPHRRGPKPRVLPLDHPLMEQLPQDHRQEDPVECCDSQIFVHNACREGFEPPSPGPEPGVLPLNYPQKKTRFQYHHWSYGRWEWLPLPSSRTPWRNRTPISTGKNRLPNHSAKGAWVQTEGIEPPSPGLKVPRVT